MNRAQKRAAKKNPNRIHGKPLIMSRIERNGITAHDLQVAEQRAFERGYNNACVPTYEICYAAAALALHQNFGFGKKRVCQFLKLMDEQVINNISSVEACERVFDEMGLEMDFSSFESCMLKG